MKISIYPVLLTAILFFNCSKEDDQMKPDIESLTQQNLQQIIDNNIGPDKLVGVSVSIGTDGQEKWTLQGGNSEADKEINSNMKFGIGSITKTFVAATILKLEEEGELEYFTDLGRHPETNKTLKPNTKYD